MNKMIQIRNVPEKLHRKLKARAAAEGMTLTDYLRGEIERLATKPTLKQWVREVRERGLVVDTEFSAAELIRQDREDRDSR
jgi:plasmid stability protein